MILHINIMILIGTQDHIYIYKLAKIFDMISFYIHVKTYYYLYYYRYCTAVLSYKLKLYKLY
jgi:hypothetical protein